MISPRLMIRSKIIIALFTVVYVYEQMYNALLPFLCHKNTKNMNF